MTIAAINPVPSSSLAVSSAASARDLRAQKRGRNEVSFSLDIDDSSAFPELSNANSHELVMEIDPSNMDFNIDDDEEDDNVEEDEDEEEGDAVDAMLEMEEERMMQMEDEGVLNLGNEDEYFIKQEDVEDDKSTSTAQQLSDFMRDRARTMSIDIEKFTSGLEIDDLTNIPLDSFIDVGDDSSILASDLPPLLLNKLISRSRSNSIATHGGRSRSNSVLTQGGRERGGSLDGILPSTVTSSAALSTINLRPGITVSFAQLDSTASARDRAFSFEFFSFGNASECPIPLPPAAEILKEDSTPLIKNGKKRTRSGSLTLFVTSRPRSDSLSLPSPGFSSSRPRGDSIIFDPTSFSDGGIHEQHALEMPPTKSADVGDNKTVEPDGTTTKESDGFSNGSMPVSPNSQAQPIQVVTSSTIASEKPKEYSVTSKLETEKVKSEVKSACESSVSSVVGKASTSSCPIPDSTNLISPDTRAMITPTPCLSHNLPPTLSSIKQSTQLTSNATPGGTIKSAPLVAGASGVSNNGSEALTVPSCITSGITFTTEILNKDGRIGIYLPEERKARLEKFHSKRKMRIWRKRIKYDCRKKLADSRPRIKGRFVRRSDVDDDT